jgi:hypothetical protein
MWKNGLGGENNMQKQTLFRYGILSIIAMSVIVSSQINTAQAFTYEGTMIKSQTAERYGIWTRDMWKFYKFTLEYGVAVEINLTYSGVLDLDLRLYIDTEHLLTDDQVPMAWDVTGYGLRPEITPIRNSQIRGTDGVLEEAYYKNEGYVYGRNVYVLIFVYEGDVGESDFILKSNITLSDVPKNEYAKNPIITTATTIFFSVLGVITLFTVSIAKFEQIPRKERKIIKLEKKKRLIEQKKEKEKLKAAKLAAKKNKNISMQKRASSSKRR